MSDHIHVYVGYSGAGGAVYQSDGTAYAFFSEQIDKPFLLTAMGSGQHTMIQELEMLALLIAAELWCPSSEGRRVVAFSDSESVRGSFLKGWSSNDPSSQVLRRILLLEERYSSHIWLERVLASQIHRICFHGAEWPGGQVSNRPVSIHVRYGTTLPIP